MADAFIDGSPVKLEVAAAAAAKLLTASRLPVIAGLGTDVAGARAAIALARRIGGAIDHMHSDSLLRHLEIGRGLIMTTRSEAGLRADTVLLVGPGLVRAWPRLPTDLIGRRPDPRFAAGPRRLYWLCPGSEADQAQLPAELEVVTMGHELRELKALLAGLRARIAGRSCRDTYVPLRSLDALAAGLAAARFGVALWSAADLDALTIEMLCGVVEDLNANTRFSGLPLAAGDNAAGVLAVCGWMTGLPLRTGFARGIAEYDPWRFDANRLVQTGESDCVLWISAYRAVAPDWPQDVPTIALTSADPGLHRRPPHIRLRVGRPGIDHDAIEELPATGTLGWVAATGKTGAIDVAHAIGHIAAALERPPC